MFGLFSKKSRDLQSYLADTRKIVIRDVSFEIRRINVMDHLEGAKVLSQLFETYKTKKEKTLDEQTIQSVKKARQFLADVILAGTVKPELSREQEEGKIHIDEVLNDWLLAQELAMAIQEYTYQAKKK